MTDPSARPSLDLDDVRRAAARLAGVANRTITVTSRSLDALANARVTFKCENLQRSGTFKFRGAFNAISALPEDDRRAGVCTISSGNHAQAVALAARELGIPAVILMPEDAPPVKIEATRGYGAEVVLYDRYSIPQYEAGQRFRRERGLPFISSHDHPLISAGAGTAALELFEDAGALDVFVAPIGGGGGMAGYATALKALCPGIRIVGAEPAASRIASLSFAAGQRVQIEVPRTIADGQQLTILGALPFEVMRALVDAVVPVEDDEIIAAMGFLLDRTKLVAEPSGAISLAAILAGKVDVAGKRVGVMISGGNVGARRLGQLLGDLSEPGKAGL